MFTRFFKGNIAKFVAVAIGVGMSFISTAIFAAAQDIGQLASNVTGTMQSVGTLLGAASYVAGFGLTIAAIFKFKAHKDNPTQVPLGTPIALLAIGIALIFLPSVVTTGGQTIFGAARTGGSFSGTGVTGTM